jgi:dTDP-4-dehydrorhamnose 3,5-epimerase
MKFIAGDIQGLFILEPTIYEDDRGWFFESFHQERFQENTGYTQSFVQDNESFSRKDVLRGLHFQLPPMAQAKLVKVLKGRVLDVAVDIRKDSATYGQYQKIELSDSNRRMFFIPEGFAHGFLALSDEVIFQYKCSNFYSPEHDSGIVWNDTDLNIDWGINNPLISQKDFQLKNFSTFASAF